MANMVEGGKTPITPAAELDAIGFSLVIFPGGIVRALGHMAGDYYASLAAHGTTEPFQGRMLDLRRLLAAVHTDLEAEVARLAALLDGLADDTHM